jgi:hypothetical protein
MLPQFREQIGNNIFMAIVYLAGGLMLNASMISVGKHWLVRSGIFSVLPVNKFRFRKK